MIIQGLKCNMAVNGTAVYVRTGEKNVPKIKASACQGLRIARSHCTLNRSNQSSHAPPSGMVMYM